MTPGHPTGWWRVGYSENPVDLPPKGVVDYPWSHRFDDIERGFRSLYCAEEQETALREVLSDLRPDRDAMQRHVRKYGRQAEKYFVAKPVTASWRRQNVLIPVNLVLPLGNPLTDLTDSDTRQEVENRHLVMLLEHNLYPFDLHEVTTHNRFVTQTIAHELFYDQGAGGVRFASCHDGKPCAALFEGRGRLEAAGRPIPLTSPPPEALTNVTSGWRLELEDTPPSAPTPSR